MTSERLFNSFIPPKNLYPPTQISRYARRLRSANEGNTHIIMCIINKYLGLFK